MSDDETSKRVNSASVSTEKSAYKSGGSSEISSKLRTYFDALAAEPIPDRFLELLEKLDEAEALSSNLATIGGRSGGSGDGGHKR